MTDYTIVIKPRELVCEEGKRKGARLYFSAPGLRFFCTSGMNDARYPAAANLAMNKAIECGLRAQDVRKVLRECNCGNKKTGKASQSKTPKQPRLF